MDMTIIDATGEQAERLEAAGFTADFRTYRRPLNNHSISDRIEVAFVKDGVRVAFNTFVEGYMEHIEVSTEFKVKTLDEAFFIIDSMIM